MSAQGYKAKVDFFTVLSTCLQASWTRTHLHVIWPRFCVLSDNLSSLFHQATATQVQTVPAKEGSLKSDSKIVILGSIQVGKG